MYLDVFFTSGRNVSCNFDFARRCINRGANSILGMLGIRGHEDALVQFINVILYVHFVVWDRGMRGKQTFVELAEFHRYPALHENLQNGQSCNH
jgi:hypothetical protein